MFLISLLRNLFLFGQMGIDDTPTCLVAVAALKLEIGSERCDLANLLKSDPLVKLNQGQGLQTLKSEVRKLGEDVTEENLLRFHIKKTLEDISNRDANTLLRCHTLIHCLPSYLHLPGCEPGSDTFQQTEERILSAIPRLREETANMTLRMNHVEYELLARKLDEIPGIFDAAKCPGGQLAAQGTAEKVQQEKESSQS